MLPEPVLASGVHKDLPEADLVVPDGQPIVAGTVMSGTVGSLPTFADRAGFRSTFEPLPIMTVLVALYA